MVIGGVDRAVIVRVADAVVRATASRSASGTDMVQDGASSTAAEEYATTVGDECTIGRLVHLEARPSIPAA